LVGSRRLATIWGAERGRVLRLIDEGIQEHKMVFGMYCIDLRSKIITDLTAFRDYVDKLRNLQWLYLHGNQILDISTLATLVNLHTLYLHGNHISDVRPLATLVNRQTLIMAEN
jgi:Leucine-rich repeat (LRR) protein